MAQKKEKHTINWVAFNWASMQVGEGCPCWSDFVGKRALEPKATPSQLWWPSIVPEGMANAIRQEERESRHTSWKGVGVFCFSCVADDGVVCPQNQREPTSLLELMRKLGRAKDVHTLTHTHTRAWIRGRHRVDLGIAAQTNLLPSLCSAEAERRNAFQRGE